MAEVSYLQLHQNDDHNHDDGFDDRDEFVNNWSNDLHGFDAYHPQSHHNLFNRENQVNFVIDMFHQRVEQSCLIMETNFHNPVDPSFHQGDAGPDMNGFEVEFELGFHVEAHCNDTRTIVDPSSQSGSPECEFTNINESNVELSCDAFQQEDNNHKRSQPNLNPNAYMIEDFDWEEMNDEREMLQMVFESEPDEDAGIHPNSYVASELDEDHPDEFAWEALLNIHNLEANTDLATGQFTDLFGQFVASSLGQPPASTIAINNLLSVVITDEDTHCAVCKDEISIGIMAKQLPCSHRYHCDCILKWLGIHNTCPLCRHELLTDDPDYERNKST